MSKAEFPKEITKDSSTAIIYKREYEKTTKDGKKTYLEYMLVYRQEGKRKVETSADYPTLLTRANEVIEDLSEGRVVDDGGPLRAAQRNDYWLAVDIVKPTGQTLLVAARHFARAVEILGSDLVIAAAQEYAKRHLNEPDPMLVEEVSDKLLEEKQRQKKSQRHIDTLTSHLTRFADSLVMNIANVTAQDIDGFLDNLKSGKPARPVSPRTRDNYADSIVTLFEWAKHKRYLPSDFDEHTRVTRLAKDEDGAIEIYTPDEMSALLATATADPKLSKLLPFLAIGAFAGLRSSEIMRLDWADVRLENGDPCIIVQKGKVKKRGKSRRIVPMSENLRAWLTPHAEKSGLIWQHHHQYLYELIGELVPRAEAALREEDPKAKLEWKQNALRHSCISYRVAQIKNVPKVALESGNSPQMIDSNYREIVTDSDSQRWFAIVP